MKQVLAVVLFLMVTGVFLAQAQESAGAQAKGTKRKAAAKPNPVLTQLNELKQALEAQQGQIRQLSDQVQSRDQQIQQLQQSLQQSQSAAAAAQSKADAVSSQAAEESQTVNSLKGDVADLKGNYANSALTLQETQKTVHALGSPAALQFKGITITPVGFIAAETVYRQRATSADINTPFTGIPFQGNALSRVSETNFSGRQSRVGLLAESTIGNAKLTGYWEGDFLGTGVTSNNRQSNSYVFRQRHLWGQVGLKSGWTFSGGQMWTLAVEDRKGIQLRQEVLPMTIDAQYNVGFTWARQYGFRAVKDFGGKVAVGISVEGPQATIGGRGFSSVTTTNQGTAAVTTVGNNFIDAPGAGGGLFNFVDTSGYSVNKAPDFVFKAAFDPGWGHYEVFGIVSQFRNRVYPCGVVGTDTGNIVPGTTTISCAQSISTNPSAAGAFDDTRAGGGVGLNFRLPIVAKKLDFAFQGLAGDGVGRYGSAQIADLTFRPDGTVALIRTGHGLAGIEGHTSKFDLYAYGGAEYGARASYVGYNTIAIVKTPAIPATATTVAIPSTTTTTIKQGLIGGYGSPFANNSGCNTENPPANQLTPSAGGTCAGDIRVIMEGTLGFWYKLYQGNKGGFRLGLQYSYFTKDGWSGNNNVAGAAGISPKAVDNVVFTSLRYYIP